MKFKLQEDLIKSEIDHKDQQIKALDELILQEENNFNEALGKMALEQKELEDKLIKANQNLKLEVQSYYNKEKINSNIKKIINYNNERFKEVYKSEISSVKKNKEGKLYDFKFTLEMAMSEPFTDFVKNSTWKHESQKLKVFEYQKIFYYTIGFISLISLIYIGDIDGFLLWLSLFFSLIMLLHIRYRIVNINFFGKGSKNHFYEKFFKKEVEPIFQEEIILLDTIKELDKELKSLI